LVNFDDRFTLETDFKNNRDISVMQENNREISVIKQRILQFAENEGISKYELYQKTGISNGVFSQKGGISEENLLKFLSYYNNINECWILRGKGEMIKNDTIDNVITIDNKNESYKFLLNRIEELAIENSALKNEITDLKKKKKYDEPGCLSIASEP
jgi:hypothetical protein